MGNQLVIGSEGGGWLEGRFGKLCVSLEKFLALPLTAFLENGCIMLDFQSM